jgi:hypothetical protein
MDRLEQLKQEAIDNPGKKKRGCTSCKNKKEITAILPPLEINFIPTINDIKTVYNLLSNVKEQEKKYINDVYIALFNEEFDFNCKSCANTQSRKLYNYITNILKEKP